MPDIDFFATRFNTQFKQFVSWKPDPGVRFYNAFSRPWSDLVLCVLLPFSLTGKVLTKIQEDQVQKAIVIALFTVHQSLVPDSAINLIHAPLPSATAARLTHAQSDQTLSSQRLAYPSSMACLRQQFSNSGISQRATNLILNSWRPGTQKQYGSAWQQYRRWCRTQQVDPFWETLSHITEFLTHEFDAGNFYRTINSYRLALFYPQFYRTSTVML